MTSKRTRNPYTCLSCGAQKPLADTRAFEFLSPTLRAHIEKTHPGCAATEHICLACLRKERLGLVHDALEEEKGELAQVENEVLQSLAEEEMVTRNADADFDQRLTVGQRISDRMASFGGSWAFIGLFGAVMALWILLNSLGILGKPFDPFPFILLNLVLSCLAAIQAPVIMMSQNRQEARDRERSVNDYRVNLKAEIEIRSLHSKIDMLISHQWQRLLEIQELQMEMLAEKQGEKG